MTDRISADISKPIALGLWNLDDTDTGWAVVVFNKTLNGWALLTMPGTIHDSIINLVKVSNDFCNLEIIDSTEEDNNDGN